jgi:multiple antibiotic resistance protein
LEQLFNCTLYLIAVINPVSKIFILSTFSKEMNSHDLRTTSIKSSLVAFIILAVFSVAGHVLLKMVFHVDLYSLKVAGGIVLAWVGFRALAKGVFFETGVGSKLTDISIVPLASPMIAGPASITAVISFSAEFGMLMAVMATGLAVIGNLVFMLLSDFIGKFLLKFNFMGALIRITGLIVMTIAVQMVFSGLGEFVQGLR